LNGQPMVVEPQLLDVPIARVRFLKIS